MRINRIFSVGVSLFGLRSTPIAFEPRRWSMQKKSKPNLKVTAAKAKPTFVSRGMMFRID
ncbi:hypothetical protein RGR602_CH00159 [Rhizobium gallicum bv. gallicum R602sp]|uniref:Uncharacterized protein n=1 Tax=Rhizobium gallicum bv. gallicum R602sp TaxID=1041138 RepID=A0A0B4WYY8_9HYPH|nr:hypothetical protein RGR602_CH00159 [Rhizobium gallicum bv. gallicum R602sp]